MPALKATGSAQSGREDRIWAKIQALWANLTALSDQHGPRRHDARGGEAVENLAGGHTFRKMAKSMFRAEVPN